MLIENYKDSNNLFENCSFKFESTGSISLLRGIDSKKTTFIYDPYEMFDGKI